MSANTRNIPTFMFNLVQRVLESRNIPPQSLIAGLDYSSEDLSRPDLRISFADAVAMIHNAYRATGDEALGLQVADAINLPDWGMMGYAVASCDTLGQALEVGLRYSAVATRLTRNSTAQTDEHFILKSSPLFPAGKAGIFMVEEDLGGIVQMLHRHLGDEANPLEIHLHYPRPGYADRYPAHFRCPVKFEQTDNQIIWPRQYMESVLPQRNPAATAMAIAQCEQLIAQSAHTTEFADQVQSMIVHNPGRFPNAAEVAANFNISESSLRRKLRACGSSYQQILDDVRKTLAIEYLSTSQLKLEAIALLLGFSDLSNFRRAFKTWTGKPPLAYRQKNNVRE